jgi:hypothetical protein
VEYKTLRVPVPLFERATKLVPDAGSLPEIQVSGGSPDEAKVLRAALVRGLDVLEDVLDPAHRGVNYCSTCDFGYQAMSVDPCSSCDRKRGSEWQWDGTSKPRPPGK